MKILYVLEYYHPNIGGVEKLFKSVAERLVEEAHEVVVVTHKSHKDLLSFEVVNGVKVRRLPMTNRFTFTFFSLPWLLGYARHCDYVHTTSYNAAVPAFFASKLFKKTCFITFHEYWGNLWFQLPRLNRISRLMFFSYEKMISTFRFRKIIAVSDYTKQSLINGGLDESKIDIIYNGVDYSQFESFHYQPPARFTFTYFGRMGISKGVNILLEAARLFFKENQDGVLKLIVPLKPKKNIDELKKFVEQNNLFGNVQLFHQLPERDLRAELCKSTCIVIPSYSEGFCFAAVEAIAMGIPVISSDKGALKEVVSGSFIKLPELNVSNLVAALRRAKNNEWEVSPVKRFPITDCVKAYKQLYQ